MALWTSIPVYILITYIVYRVISSWIVEYRFQQFARRNGCEEPQRNTLNKLPWGIDGIFRILRSASKGMDILDDIVIPRYETLRATTIVGTGLMGQQIADTIEPRNIQALLATNFKDFATGERRSKQLGAVLGHGIFNSDGEFWAHSRAMFRPAFSREHINDLEDTDRSAKILMGVLPMGEGGWTQNVNLMDYLHQFTLDTATAFLFGHTTDSLLSAAGKPVGEKRAAGTTADQEFVDAFSVAQEWLSWRVRAQGLYWLVSSKRWKKAVDNVRAFIGQYVQMALHQKSQEARSGEKDGERRKYNLLKEMANECRDPVELRDQLLSILAAGRDTTAALLSWVFVELALHPDIYLELRRAILEEIGDASADVSTLDFSKLKSCRYLQFVLQETLRLHPPVPLNTRQAIRDTVLPVGGGPAHDRPVAIRKGQLVNFTVYGLQRRKDLWGEDADMFRPQRWDGRKNGWDFIPFSGGPRICLGQQFAITEASFLVVRLLQTYDAIEWHGETGHIAKGFGLVMYPAKGVPVRLHRVS